MRILHYYRSDDPMVGQHVTMLTSAMGLEAENHTATEAEQARTLLKGAPYDILHLHGCWRNSSRSIVNMALRQGIRLVLTPHGQLEPWVQEDGRWKEKLPKRWLYQRDIVGRAYAVIIQGSMEQECMQKLGWNTRTIIIRNAVVTNSITPADMARQTYTLYQKVMDSNPLELMTDETLDALTAIIKAGITGDKRWITQPYRLHDLLQWRHVLCFAHQEHITDTIQRGVRVLGLEAPDVNVEAIPYFLPDNYQETQSIQSIVGNQFTSENKRLIATFRLIRKLVSNRQFCIRHLIELDRELRHHDCKEGELSDSLKGHRLWKLACRTMQLMQDLTGLTEGFMPVPPLNDRYTRRIRQHIDGHLKIY